ncbi:hypothetical protein H4F17_18710 [Vibrio cholerae]
MNNEELQLLEELKGKIKLSPKERAQLKSLERKAQKEAKQESKATTSKPQTNVFGAVATTKIKPLPIRLTNNERAGLKNRADDLKANNTELVMLELGGLREINETKLIRAAIKLLSEHSDEEIIKAIKDVKMEMFSGAMNDV